MEESTKTNRKFIFDDPEVLSNLNLVGYVLVPVDIILFACKTHYIKCFISEHGMRIQQCNKTYTSSFDITMADI